MSEFLSELLSIGGAELESEEAWLRREARDKGGFGGILTIDLVCFCPYVFIRAVLPKYRGDHAFAHEGRPVADVEITRGRARHAFIVDHWKDEPLQALEEDVERLGQRQGELHLLIMSANPPVETEDRMRKVGSLAGVGPQSGMHRFDAETGAGEIRQFWVGAWSVQRPRPAR
jgi:hypothetical protein